MPSGPHKGDAQRDRLTQAGAIRVFTDVGSGKRFDRPGLAELLDHARPGDRLCVTRLDRLGRSLRELLEIVANLEARGVHFVSLEIARLSVNFCNAGVHRVCLTALSPGNSTDRPDFRPKTRMARTHLRARDRRG